MHNCNVEAERPQHRKGDCSFDLQIDRRKSKVKSNSTPHATFRLAKLFPRLHQNGLSQSSSPLGSGSLTAAHPKRHCRWCRGTTLAAVCRHSWLLLGPTLCEWQWGLLLKWQLCSMPFFLPCCLAWVSQTMACSFFFIYFFQTVPHYVTGCPVTLYIDRSPVSWVLELKVYGMFLSSDWASDNPWNNVISQWTARWELSLDGSLELPNTVKTGMVACSYNLSTWEVRQEDWQHEFETSQNDIVLKIERAVRDIINLGPNWHPKEKFVAIAIWLLFG